MKIQNAVMKTLIPFDGESILVDVNFDYVNDEVYINEILFQGDDIKSIVNEHTEQKINELICLEMRK